tara:strand:+ start:158 stop:412 length:255 start_codon:yes stop_codon:yes gene_type:complete
VQIERVLEVDNIVDYPFEKTDDDLSNIPKSALCMDPFDPSYSEDKGRMFLIKWKGVPYAESSYECERDLKVSLTSKYIIRLVEN